MLLLLAVRVATSDTARKANPCVWRVIVPKTGTIMALASEDPPSEVSDGLSGCNFSRINMKNLRHLLFVDVASSKTLDVDFDEVQRTCPEANSNTEKVRGFYLGPIESLLLGISMGSSVDLVRFSGQSGRGIPKCGETLYAVDEVNEWALSPDRKTLTGLKNEPTIVLCPDEKSK
jgi:hypothetical protein